MPQQDAFALHILQAKLTDVQLGQPAIQSNCIEPNTVQLDLDY